MPVEITLPLTKLEQAVADARENERVLAAKVEDIKLQLKTAKSSWEESVEELKNAVDEMIRDKRQPSLPFDADDEANDEAGTGGPSNPNPPTPAGNPAGDATESAVTVEIISPPPSVVASHFPELAALPPAAAGQPSWRTCVVAEHIDGPASLFDTLATFGVETMGQLADRLQDGQTFNLPLIQVHDLWELIEDASADDPEPIKFYRGNPVPVTVKEEDEDGAEVPQPRDLFAPESEPVPAAKPAKKSRGGRKKKDKAVEVGQPAQPVEPDAPKPEPASQLSDPDDPFAGL